MQAGYQQQDRNESASSRHASPVPASFRKKGRPSALVLKSGPNNKNLHTVAIQESEMTSRMLLATLLLFLSSNVSGGAETPEALAALYVQALNERDE